MFSACANPDCESPFVYGQGRIFRFHKQQELGVLPNTHCVQHFWLCMRCCQEFTLEYDEIEGVVLRNRPDITCRSECSRFIAGA